MPRLRSGFCTTGPPNLDELCIRKIRDMVLQMYKRSAPACAGPERFGTAEDMVLQTCERSAPACAGPERFGTVETITTKDCFLRLHHRYAGLLWDEMEYERHFHRWIPQALLCRLARRTVRDALRFTSGGPGLALRKVTGGRFALAQHRMLTPLEWLAFDFFDRCRRKAHGPTCRCLRTRLLLRVAHYQGQPRIEL